MGWDKKNSRYLGPTTAGAMLFGAVIGGVAAAAANARKVQQGEMSNREAALDALREAGTTGLSAGAGVAAMCRLGVGGFAGLVGITVVAAGTKYLLDTVVAEALAKGCAACAAAAGKDGAGAEAPAPKAAAARPAAAKAPAAKASAKGNTAKPKAAKPKAPAKPKAAPEAPATE